MDIVGTGGDGDDTINISTASVVLAAACGCTVAKAGNRSVSSACGSADVLEALGVKVDLNPAQVVRTCFNILGPMTKEAVAQRVVIGVFHEELLELMVETQNSQRGGEGGSRGGHSRRWIGRD